MANSENGTIYDVIAAVDLLVGTTVSLDELCDLMPERSRQSICTSMNSIVRTSGKARGITVVRKANPKTWRISGAARKPIRVDTEDRAEKSVEIRLRRVGEDSNGSMICSDPEGKLYRVTPL